MNRSKKVVRMGMDMGKSTFHLFGVDKAGFAAVKKKLRLNQLLVARYFSQCFNLLTILGQDAVDPFQLAQQQFQIDFKAS